MNDNFLLRCVVHRANPGMVEKPQPPIDTPPSPSPSPPRTTFLSVGDVKQEKEKMVEFSTCDLFADLTWSVLTRLGYSDEECILAKCYVKLQKWNYIPADVICDDSNASIVDVFSHLKSFVSIHVLINSTPKHQNMLLKRNMKDKLLAFILKSDLLTELHCPVDVHHLLGKEVPLATSDLKEVMECFDSWCSNRANSMSSNEHGCDNNNNSNNKLNILFPNKDEPQETTSLNNEPRFPHNEFLTIRHESLPGPFDRNKKTLNLNKDTSEGRIHPEKRMKASHLDDPTLEEKQENEMIPHVAGLNVHSSKITWRPAFENKQKENLVKCCKETRDGGSRIFDQMKMEEVQHDSLYNTHDYFIAERGIRRSSDSEMVEVDDLSDGEDSLKSKIKFSKEQECSKDVPDHVTIKNEGWNDNLSQEKVASPKRLPLQYANFLDKYPDSFNNQNFLQDSEAPKEHSIYTRGNFRETPPAFFSPPLFLKEFHGQSPYPSNDAGIHFPDEEESKMTKKHSKTYQTSHTETHFSVNYISKWQNRKQSSEAEKKTGNGKSFRNSGSPEFEASPGYSRDDSGSSVRSLQRRYSKSSGYDQLQFVDQRRQHAMHSFQAAMSQAFNFHCLRHPALFYPHQPNTAHASSSAFDPAKMLAVAAAVVGGGSRSGAAPAISPSGSQDGTGSSDGDRRKRSRVFIDPLTEIPRLERWFNDDTHPSAFMIEQFTEELNRSPYRQRFPSLEPKNVQLWFKNHRAKVKRQKLEMNCSASAAGTSTTNSTSSGGPMKPGMSF